MAVLEPALECVKTAVPEPPMELISKNFMDVGDKLKEMESFVAKLRKNVAKECEEYNFTMKKLMKDQAEMRSKLEALQRLDNQANEKINEIMISSIRLLDELRLNSDEKSAADAASNENQPPPVRIFVRNWLIERLKSEEARAEAALLSSNAFLKKIQTDDEQDQEGVGVTIHLQGDDTTVGGKTEIKEISSTNRKRSSSVESELSDSTAATEESGVTTCSKEEESNGEDNDI